MKNTFLLIGSLIVLAIIGFGVYQHHQVQVAHSTFENYYAFRGCEKLLDKTDTYATCVTNSGQTIKIVLYQDKWYLDGDLPCPGPISLKYFLCAI